MNFTHNGSARTRDDSATHILWLFYFILFVAFALRAYSFVGIVGTDDVSIADYALRLLDSGPWVPQTHYQARVGLIYPLAAVYAIFGVGDWQSALIPLAASLVGVWLAFLIARQLAGDKAGLLAALAIAVFPLDVFGATQLMPDLPLGVLLAAAFYLALRMVDEVRSVGLALGAGLVWGLAYLVKIEAAFLLVPLLALLIMNPKKWRDFLMLFSAVAAIVILESLVYWLAGGSIMQRLVAVQNQGGGRFVKEYSETQLWVFPKAWFITFYDFAIHYYLLFAGIVWIIIARAKRFYPVVVWVVVYLVWLQFGGNPFSELYHVKSHLLRYCNMIAVPMAVVIGGLLEHFFREGRGRVGIGLTGLMVAIGIFFINFDTLSYERQVATKRGINYALSHDLFPLYMDRTSFALASIYMRNDPRIALTKSLQRHHFDTQKTELIDVAAIEGYALINKGFEQYAWNRYRMDKVDVKGEADELRVIYRVDNPGNPIAYAQARLLHNLSRLIPVAFLRDKIGATSRDLLEGDDVVIVTPRGGEGSH